MEHDLFRKPVSTFWDHALARRPLSGIFGGAARRFLLKRRLEAAAGFNEALQA
jgi:hypothetical protein